MKILYIVPSLAAKAPIEIVRQLSVYVTANGNCVSVYYFDDICELSFSCETKRISSKIPIAFDNFDLVHTHGFRPDMYVAKFRRTIRHAKWVSTLHCDIFADFKYLYDACAAFVLEKYWLHRLKHCNTVVQINDYLFEKYKNSVPCTLIYNGVSLAPYQHEIEHTEILQNIKRFRHAGLTVICSYSVILKRKGLHQILRLLKKDSRFAYVCIGDGADKGELLSYAQKNDLSDRVYFSPFVRTPYHILPDVDVFAIPSYSEGFSLALLEAGLTGASVVCSDIPAFNKVFSKSEVAFFRLDDISSLQAAVEDALAHKETRIQNLRQKIQAHYAIQCMQSRYEALYTELVK